MKLLNYFKKKKGLVNVDLNCQVEHITAASAVELYEKINDNETNKGVKVTSIVAAILYISEVKI